ncbi:monofunctional biosynthetic peptidoglycan transglycosylase [Shewanella acanthi]|uniref:monofunctional biosynthetic peptidoglycan transglycosylase n=1 Tax=Shewanella acanthi TaxID=2864212 RepID=UPI001C65CF60|nr:monofunctional biosynthetic peptidoglycan transglycosylase [Shewanella acanthi]QYJ79545.1 monofunctional biosynthetic peptidoglycan transglycosylase [Shewanella acanthi]
MTPPMYASRDFANPLRSEPPKKPQKTMIRRIFVWVFKLVLLLWLSSIAMVVLLRFVDPPIWTWRIERALFPPAPISQVKHQWQPLANISPQMQLAVIAAEDQKFANHSGFDLEAITNALEYNQKGNKVRGASTLSQQTAKNLFMWSSRSFIRKGIEAWFTLLMELVWDKSRILEVYLNIVEFGPGIYGAEAAAKHYFGKPAAKLTSYEASLLAAILPNPWTYKIAPPSRYVSQRSAWIRKQMNQLGQVTLNRVHAAD